MWVCSGVCYNSGLSEGGRTGLQTRHDERFRHSWSTGRVVEGRQLGVIVDGLPQFDGAQLAQDTTASGLAEEVVESRRESVRIVSVIQETASRSWCGHAFFRCIVSVATFGLLGVMTIKVCLCFLSSIETARSPRGLNPLSESTPAKPASFERSRRCLSCSQIFLVLKATTAAPGRGCAPTGAM